ncbi:5'-3' exoribonuclease 4-like isoform X2 [Corylus avellana]|uniref:5'-3' exoribonuclease 4-like isoform X2 n=1 Tax=Corylus avellana TaxID=13451 RepID=UPI00286A171B|nr:5'-3' exoribonuclease 4-like isoform X2 [Corylus avellana]
MGIPAFYRWLVDRYPLAVVPAIEDEPPVTDTTRPNPNGYEFDNLYLDMNGIVHPCFHPDGLPPPKSYEDVFLAVFNYIDRIFSIVRPRKLLYLAIDGVAPRAKMNQQRSRRFRAAKDAAEEASGREWKLEAEEEKSASLEQSKKLDSNVITPGTEFMVLLSSALRYYVHLRMNRDAGWREIKVILSDANVPGEGEHKIMSYIRLQRNLPGYDPNTRHCLYGLDADLIMLALATHEIHCSILREDVRRASLNDKSLKRAKNSLPINRQEERGNSKQMEVVGENLEDYVSRQKFQFLNIWVLREYLTLDMKVEGMKQKAERRIDDFVFMCLFVGNDFLPHIPSLEISEGAIDLLMMVYKKEFVKMGGYLTNSFEVNLERVEHFVRAVGSHECAIFRRRSQVEKDRELQLRRFSSNKRVRCSSNLMSQNPPDSRAVGIQTPSNCTSIGANAIVDKIKLGEMGWKERFYAEKFEAESEDDRNKIQRDAVFKYIEGICWVMRYYYEGVCSWQWFYPYHFAPFASDFHGFGQLKIKFTLGKPFKPFDQLLSVLPAASAHSLPLFYRKLMTDMSSPLLDFYPTDFELDMNGKRFSWQAICKLPFIDEARLLSEITKVEHTLTDEERRRNSFSLDVLFVHISHPLAVEILSLCEKKAGHPNLPEAKVKKINPEFSGGMNGYMYISGEPVQPAEIYSPIEDMEMILNNEVLSVFFKCPPFHSHIPRPSKRVKLPRKSVWKQDILAPPVLWHEKSAVLGRIFSEPSTHKSISGHRLAKLAHELLSKCYNLKSQKAWGSMELADHIGADGLTSHSNLEETVHVGGTGHNENCIDGVIPDSHVGEDKLSCHLNLEEMVCASIEGDNNCFDGKAKKRIWSECNGHSTDVVVDGLACSSNLEGTVTVGGAGGDEICINIKSRKRRRKGRKLRDTLESNVGTEKLECPLNLGPTVCEVGTEADENSVDNGVPNNQIGETGASGLACNSVAPDKKCVNGKPRKQKRKRKQSNAIVVLDNHEGVKDFAMEPTGCEVGTEADKNSVDNGVPNNHIGETGASGLAYHSVAPDKKCVNGKSRKHKRKRKQNNAIVVLDNHEGAKDFAMEPTGCEVGTEADKNSVDNGVPNNHIGETGASGLACHSVAPDKKCVNGKSRKQKRKRKQRQNNAIVVPDNHEGAKDFAMEPTGCEVGTEADKNSVDNGVPNNHIGETVASGLACHSVPDNHEGAKDLAMGPTVCEVGTEADKNSVDNGVPNNHIGEIGASGLACHSVVPDKKCVNGKSRKQKRKRKQRQNNVLNNHEGAKDLAFPSDLLLTVCEAGVGADKNCVDNGAPNKLVGETGANGFACANEVQDYGKSCKRKRKRKQSTGAVKCVDHGVPEKQVGETGENGFAGANVVPDKNCVDDKLRRQEGSKVPGSVDEKHS